VLQRGGQPYRQYSFKHALVQDTAYESLLNAQRLEAHRRVAEEIERRDRVAEAVELLAHHYGCAKCNHKAFYYLHLAGKKSLGMYSLLEAERYFFGALEQLDAEPACADDRVVADVIAKILQVMFLKGDIPKLRGITEQYLPRLEAMGDSSEFVIASSFLALALGQLAEYRAATAVAQKAMATAVRIGEPAALAYARVSVLRSSGMLGGLSLQATEELASQALVDCATTNDSQLEAAVYFNMSMTFATRGLMIQARDWCQKLSDVGSDRGDRRVRAMALWQMSWYDIVEERFDEALMHAQECLDTAIVPFDRIMATITCATAKILGGHPEEGLPELLEARRRALESGLATFESFSHGGFAAGLALTGRVAQAICLLKTSIAASDAAGHLPAARRNRMILVRIYLAILTGGGKAVSVRAVLNNLWAILGAKLYGRRRVQSLLNELDRDEWISEQGIWRAQIDLDSATLCKISGQPERATELLNRAREAAKAQNATALLGKIDAALAELNSP
jgi:hypothetical protein